MFKIIRDPLQQPPPRLMLSSSSRPTQQPEEEEAPPSPQILLPCPICFRTFAVSSLDRHKNVCQKVVSTQKRKPFDSSKQRVGDLDVPCSSSPVRSAPASSPLGRKYFTSSPSSSLDKTQPSWKEKHLSLIKTVREARAAADANRCPYCERNFGSKAFDRHMEWCREQQSRMPKSPTNINSEAKERWEARTKYRAPSLRRSVRSFSRDKYSPTRSLFSGGRESRDNSVDRLTVVTDFGGVGGGGGQSLSGSRASLDSRGSSTYSYQPPPTHQYNNISNLYGHHNNNKASTLGRVGGSNFLRQANERRSLRTAPSSPPPFIFQQTRSPPPPPVLNLDPINNNRTSALRASLRMKNNPFSSSSSGSNSPSVQQHNTVNAAVQKKKMGSLFSPFSSTSSVQCNTNKVQPKTPTSPLATSNSTTTTKRPSVLQLFTSAFSRPSPVVPAKNHRQHPTTTTLSSSQQQGRRSEPEGVESKLMPTASCYSANLLNSYGRSSSPVSSKIHQQPLSSKSSGSSSRYPSSGLMSDSTSSGGGGGYNPYLSAERQMAELFEDNRPSVLLAKRAEKEASMMEPPTPPPRTSLLQQQQKPPAEQASMEQLEMDLKSILSEISQLGNKDRETNAWNTKKASLGVVNSNPLPSGMKEQQPEVQQQQSPSGGNKELPKFCHQCGAAYPQQYVVKFCCQCGSRRLFV